MNSSRIKEIQERHMSSFFKMILMEIFLRLYKLPVLRKVLNKFYKQKKPSNHIFLLGVYNSGTTIIKKALSLHPNIDTLPIEGDNLTSELSNFEANLWPRCAYGNISELINSTDIELDRSALDRDWSPWYNNGNYFLEKSIANSLRIRNLKDAYPNCKFIVVVRNMDDVNRGIARRSAPKGRISELLGVSSGYSDGVLNAQWHYFYNKIYKDLQNFPDSDYITLSYERFLSEPVELLQSIYDFLELSSADLKYVDSELSLCDNSIHIRQAKNKNFVPPEKINDFLSEKLSNSELI